MKYLAKIMEMTNLEAAFRHVRGNKGGSGIDRVSIDAFAENLEHNLGEMQSDLRQNTFTFQPVLLIESRKLKRNLAILTVRDRIIHQAITQIIANDVEKYLHDANYSYREGRSAIHATTKMEKQLAKGEYPFIFRCDILKFFDNISHETLRALLSTALQAPYTVGMILAAMRIEELHFGQVHKKIRGISQGAPLSPLLSNIYLTPFDRFVEKLNVPHYRFCDDIAILLRTKEQYDKLLPIICSFLKEYLQLEVNKDKTCLYEWQQGFNFLGFHFSPLGKKPSKKACNKLENNLASTDCLKKKKQFLQGWQTYYGQSNTSLKKTTTYVFIESFLALFKGNPHYFAQLSINQQNKRYQYVPVKRSLGEEDIIQHLLGKTVLGIYLLDKDYVYSSCLDIDIKKNVFQQHYYTNPGEFALYADRALSFVRKIEKFLIDEGIHCLLEESGYKGYHLWIFFAKQTLASEVVYFWNKILDAIDLPQGINVEIFPRESKNNGQIGSLVKLPLGKHPFTHNRTMFIDAEGEYIANPHNLVQSFSKIAPQHFAQLLQLQPEKHQHTPISRLIESCCVVRNLCEKAQSQKDLGHFERMVLLYTLGQLGKEGQKYLHKIIGYCSNYDFYYTQKQIERKHPAPMSCRTIHEIMGRNMNSLEHCCNFHIPEGGYPSPILHIYPNATKNLACKIKKSDISKKTE